MTGRERASTVDATEIARRVLGDKIASNMLMVGFAYQKGLLPVGIESIERAIELNGVAEAARSIRTGIPRSVNSASSL
jgi:indolepyruvate ferredoxin oxidoreductase